MSADANDDMDVGITFKGYLEKKGNMRWQQRWFELHGDTLIYFNEKGEKPRGELVLSATSTVGALSAGDATGFQVIFAGGKALKVRAPTNESREVWIKAIHEVISEVSSLQSVVCPKTEEVFTIPKRYVVKTKLGQGAYGCVAAGVDEELGKQVAIKKVKNAFDDNTDAKRILREIRLMRSLKHPNVLNLYDLIRPPSLEHFNDVYIVTTRMDQDLQSIVFSKTPLCEDQVQWILYQCLAGIKYLHSAGVVHRDLKPANLLIDLESCDVKICDFGLSRIIEDETAEGAVAGAAGSTLYVVTRWYRAPEVLLGYTHYDKLVDIWSLGCIFGELLYRRPLLNGDNFVNQLEKINDFLGTTPQEDLWFVTNEKALNFMTNVLPKKRGVDVSVKFPNASPEAINLLLGMLTVDPRKRLDANRALDHAFLAPVREAPHYEMDAGFTVDADDIEAMELTDTNLKRMMFQVIERPRA
jgi:mitogen-activated protein kinase 1/3